MRSEGKNQKFKEKRTMNEKENPIRKYGHAPLLSEENQYKGQKILDDFKPNLVTLQ